MTIASLPAVDRFAIEDLLTSYCWLLDHGRGAEAGDLFEEDGRLSFMGRDLKGRDAIKTALQSISADKSRVVRHVWHGLRVLENDDCFCRLTTIALTFLAPAEAPMRKQIMLGDTDDLLIKNADSVWRFSSRLLSDVMPFESMP